MKGQATGCLEMWSLVCGREVALIRWDGGARLPKTSSKRRGAAWRKGGFNRTEKDELRLLAQTEGLDQFVVADAIDLA